MRYVYLTVILLFAISANAATIDYDSTRQMRVAVYNLLGMDTTGTANLPTAAVDQHVKDAIQRVNVDCQAYKRRDLKLTIKGRRMYKVDSLLELLAASYVQNDSVLPMSIIDIDTFGGAKFIPYLGKEVADRQYSRFITKWMDSVWFIPTPINVNDTISVLYVHLLPLNDSTLLPSQYKQGAIYYAAILAALDVESPKIEYFRQLYESFLIPFRKEEVGQ